jgi:polyisoprenoid-binding protein YceI
MTHRLTRHGALFVAAVAVSLVGCMRQPPSDSSSEPANPPAAEKPAANWTTEAPAGEYKVEPSHASVTLRVDHLGFSKYTARFKKLDGTLKFDPVDPVKSSIEAAIDVASLETDFPFPEKVDFNAELTGPNWLDAKQSPQITFRSTRIDLTGERTMDIHGDLTMRGVTKPVTLQATFNGGYAGHPMDPNARIGFSARSRIQRSEFGVSYGIPAPGTTMGVGDDVEIWIEVEFTGPPLAKTEAAPPAA